MLRVSFRALWVLSLVCLHLHLRGQDSRFLPFIRIFPSELILPLGMFFAPSRLFLGLFFFKVRENANRRLLVAAGRFFGRKHSTMLRSSVLASVDPKRWERRLY